MPYNVLSLDGGGVRGIITLLIINEIMIRINNLVINDVSVLDVFDFYSGSSIGSMIVCALLTPSETDLGRPKFDISELIDLMDNISHKIFFKPWWQNLKTIWGLRLPKYVNDLREKFYPETFGDLRFGSLLKPVVFPCGDMISRRPIYIHNRVPKYESLSVCDILMGTSGAPTYFPSKLLYIDGVQYNLIDSGCVVNNTAELSWLEARKFYNSDDIYVVSIGTGYSISPDKNNSGGICHWGASIANTLIDLDSFAQEYELSLLTDKTDRLNIKIPPELNEMDRPEYIPKYKILTMKWLKDNDDLINSVVTKLIHNKGFTLKL